MLRVDVVYTGLQGLPGRSSLYFSGTGEALALEAAEAVNNFFVAINTYILDQCTVEVMDLVTEIEPTNGLVTAFHAAEGSVIPGVSVSEAAPIGTSVVLGLRTNAVVRGRRVQGRIYIPCVPRGLVEDDGVMNEPTVFNFESLAETNLITPTSQPVVWSRPTDTAPGSEHVVTDVQVPSVLSNLRTRRR